MKPRSPSIVRKWKRGIAVGCSHGLLIDEGNRKAVLEFAERWKADTAIHLGDAVDLECFMANGKAESRVKPQDDFDAGISFVTDFFEAGGRAKDRILFCGNHEDRLWKLTNSPREVVAYAAQQGVNAFHDAAKRLKAELVPYDNLTGHRRRGDALFMHGYMYNEMFIRDHAEAFGGKVVLAHGHKAGIATGRTLKPSIAYCTGTLANIPAMKYAKTLRARLSWSAGVVPFEYCDTETAIWLFEKTRESGWRFPL